MEEDSKFYQIGVTGHRQLLKKEALVFECTKNVFLKLLDHRKLSTKEVRVLTGMALGFDQLVCDVCLELGIPYVACVPCDEQDALWKPQQRERYSILIGKAQEVINVSPGPYAPWKMHARNGHIVNNVREMVSHWDGLFAGGTGGCMKLVKAKKLPWSNTIPQ